MWSTELNTQQSGAKRPSRPPSEVQSGVIQTDRWRYGEQKPPQVNVSQKITIIQNRQKEMDRFQMGCSVCCIVYSSLWKLVETPHTLFDRLKYCKMWFPLENVGHFVRWALNPVLNPGHLQTIKRTLYRLLAENGSLWDTLAVFHR